MVSSRDASAPPQKKCKKKGLPHYLMRQPLFATQLRYYITVNFKKSKIFSAPEPIPKSAGSRRTPGPGSCVPR